MATYVMENLSKDLVDALKSIVFDCNWQNVGKASSFEALKCYRLFSCDETEEDILLIKDKLGNFYAIEAICSHEGGPLDEGDIEELGNKLLIICPWHNFDFDLSNGLSSTGLRQQTFETHVVDENVYINVSCELSLSRSSDEDRVDESKSLIDDQAEVVSAETGTLSYWAVRILKTPDPKEKCSLTHEVAEKWRSGELEIGFKEAPDMPERDEGLSVLEPNKIKRGKGGTLGSRIALIHSLANIEQWAIDLSWDIICRFSSLVYPDGTKLPNEFFNDFIKVACDEAKHFGMLEKRLVEMGSYFGALPVHNGLWESATVTKDNFLSRLAIVHMVHEARGLDVHPQTRLRFLNAKDEISVELLDTLYADEITHVAAGIKWFQYGCEKQGLSYIETFHDLVRNYFVGYLKPPFDTAGRKSAGMAEEWYMPLIKANKE